MRADVLLTDYDVDPGEQVAAHDRDARLEVLRTQAARCRTAAHLDLHRACLASGDTDSFTFLLSRRIPHEYRRSVAFLVHGLVTPPEEERPQATSGS